MITSTRLQHFRPGLTAVDMICDLFRSVFATGGRTTLRHRTRTQGRPYFLCPKLRNFSACFHSQCFRLVGRLQTRGSGSRGFDRSFRWVILHFFNSLSLSLTQLASLHPMKLLVYISSIYNSRNCSTGRLRV
jgi:hypothetical protein